MLKQGREAYKSGDYERAVMNYKEAAEQLPAGNAVGDRREVIVDHLADGSVALAEEHRRAGNDEAAEKVLKEVFDKDPGNEVVRKQQEALDDPIRTNPAVARWSWHPPRRCRRRQTRHGP